MKLNEVYQVFGEIQRSISKLEDGYGNLDVELRYDFEDEYERYEGKTARAVIEKLNEINDLLEWIEKPVVSKGRLYKNSDGRYEIGYTDKEVTSGSIIDYWDVDYEDYKNFEWVKSRIEHNGKDYYIVSRGRDKNIEGVMVRTRK